MRREIGHSSLFDMGVYCINAARYFFQAEPQEVMAMHFTGTDERAIDAEEMTSALCGFPTIALRNSSPPRGPPMSRNTASWAPWAMFASIPLLTTP